jgi:L-ascorbate metabolism protein UlaG (beta-lactamase superfamily)
MDRIFISGDSGYGKHYRIIGEKYGPFDMALLENGQYSPYWKNLHSFPCEIRAIMKDIDAKVLFPIHWAKFTISSHNWLEPIAGLFASNPDFPVTVPQIGELIILGDPEKTDHWWEDITCDKGQETCRISVPSAGS